MICDVCMLVSVEVWPGSAALRAGLKLQCKHGLTAF